MKRYDIIFACTVALSLASCVSEEINQSASVGKLSVEVETVMPMKTTRAGVPTDNFLISIFQADGQTKFDGDNYYEKTKTQLPSQITLPVNENGECNYVLTAHSPEEFKRIMDVPYFRGSNTILIKKNMNTEATIHCRQANTSIKLTYSADFLATFTSWSVTVDDGNNLGLEFLSSNGTDPDAKYCALAAGVSELVVNFVGTTTDGATVRRSMALTKAESTQTYEGESDNFGGGDAVVINLKPEETTSGFVTIGIEANIVFEETEVNVPVNVVDNGEWEEEGGNGEEPGPGPQPGDDNTITLTLPAPVTLSADEAATADPSSGDVVISADKGLKSVSVKVLSSSDEMMEQLAAVAGEYPGVDLVNGCEVVGNQNLVAFLASLSKVITVPAEGDTNYTFPVGQFYLFLGILPGEHNFVMTVTDMEGNQKSGTVKVTITE